MNEVLHITLALIVGLALGTFFFGGLWLTVKKAVNAKTPALWFLISSFIRVAVTLVGFYFTANGDLKRLLICLLGFLIARFIVTRLTKSNERQQIEFKKEVSHEA